MSAAAKTFERASVRALLPRKNEARSMSILSVVKLRIDPSKVPAIVAEANDVLREESKTQAGFIAGEILVSRNRKTIVIMTEWVDSHAWSRSRYDVRVGKMLEDCLNASDAIEFEIYDRHARFPLGKDALADDARH